MCIALVEICGYPNLKINFMLCFLEWIFAVRKQFNLCPFQISISILKTAKRALVWILVP
jgi:hypothetical protein